MIWTPLLTAAGSLLVAIFGLVTARKAKSLAAEAEEASKRSEQVRLRATNAGESILASIAQVLIGVEAVRDRLSYSAKKSLTEQEMIDLFQRLSTPVRDLRLTIYSTAIYTMPSLRDRIEDFLQPLHKGGISFEQWEKLISDLKAIHADVAKHFYETYLNSDFHRRTETA